MKTRFPHDTLRRLLALMAREVAVFRRRPLLFFCMAAAPLLCMSFFTTLMSDGLPTDLPTGLVDEDNTKISRTMARTLNAMQEVDITHAYRSVTEAREAMQRGEIYSFFYIPRGTTVEAVASWQPRVSFYTNDAYFVPGSMTMKDLKTASELTGLALTREVLRKRGATEDAVMDVLRPIEVDTHPLGNPTLNYAVYLNNMLLPGILILLTMLSAAYAIGMEWKLGTQREWYRLAGCSQTLALAGKLLPQTVLFTLMFWVMDVWFYGIEGYPCRCGAGAMLLLGFVTVLAAQAFAVFFMGVNIGQLRLSMCLCSLWGILSFSLAGFTYPVTAMAPGLRTLAWLFPLRHYYIIYVNRALNGYPLHYVLPHVLALATFLLLPLLVIRPYRRAILTGRYRA